METSTLLIILGVAAAVGLFAGKFIYSWYAEIPTRNKCLKAQIDLLALIAENAGVERTKITAITKHPQLVKIDLSDLDAKMHNGTLTPQEYDAAKTKMLETV